MYKEFKNSRMEYKYNVIDEAIINATPERVFNSIINMYDGIEKWWFPFVSAKLKNGKSSKEYNSIYKVTIHGSFPVSFTAKTIDIKKTNILK